VYNGVVSRGSRLKLPQLVRRTSPAKRSDREVNQDTQTGGYTMTHMNRIHVNDHELAKLTRGLKLVKLGTCHQYWDGSQLKYKILFDNKACTYKVYQLARRTNKETVKCGL